MTRKNDTVRPVKNVRIPESVRSTIADAAAREHRSVSNFLVTAALERVAAQQIAKA